MGKAELNITPKTKVGELLDAYPALEAVLMKMSPAFEKLKNPVLRRTVAKVATLSQVAVAGGLKVEDIVNRLRKEAGFDAGETEEAESAYLSESIPSWYLPEAVKEIYDASPVINAGESPLGTILSKARSLNQGEILEIHTPFLPAPVIDMLKEQGYRIFTISEKGEFKTMVSR